MQMQMGGSSSNPAYVNSLGAALGLHQKPQQAPTGGGTGHQFNFQAAASQDADSQAFQDEDNVQDQLRYPVGKLTAGFQIRGRLLFSLWRVLRSDAKLPNANVVER